MRKEIWILVIAVLLITCGGEVSAVNLLTNPGFEDPVAANNTQLNVTPTGWALVGANGGRYLYRPVPVGTYPPTEGAQRFVVSNKTLITQQVEAIEANTIYTFKIDVLPYTYNANDEGGRISLRVYNGSNYVVLARSEDYRSVNYRTWGVVTAQWDSTNYPQFWGKPLTAAMHVTAANTMFFDKSSLEKAASTKKISITRDIPESFIAVSENGVTYDFNMELLQAPTSDVSIVVDPNYSQVDLGAGVGAPVTLTFTSSNWNIPQAVTVSAVNDDVAEDVTFDILNFSISSSDPAYNSSDPNVAACLSPLSVKVVDDDGVGQLLYNGGFELPDATIEARSYYKVSDGWEEYQSFAQGYRYDPPSTSAIQPTEGDTRISLLWGSGMIQPVGSLIEANTGYVFALDRRTLLATNLDWTLKIACYDSLDMLDPANVVVLSENRYQSAVIGVWERFYVVWNSASAPEYVGKKLAVILTSALDGVIMDNSTLNKNYVLLQETDGATVVSERASLGNTDTYSIVLTRQPTADVTITATPPADAESIDLGAGVGVPVILTFTSSNWDTPQTITVTAIDDATNEGKTPKTYSITHVAASSDSYLGGAYVKTVNVTVNDDDYPAILFSDAAALEVTESGQTDQYGVYLQIAPTADVTVTLTPSVDVTVDPSVLTFTTSNWNTPQTITVTAVNDSETEVSPEIATIAHVVSSADPGYAAVTAVTVNVSVIDNDYCGNWGFYQADLNQDCYVNMADFYIMASSWLDCSHPADPACTMVP